MNRYALNVSGRLLRANRWWLPALLALSASAAQAGMFDDEEARKAILDLRPRIQTSDENSRAKLGELGTAQAHADASPTLGDVARDVASGSFRESH